MDPNGTAEHGQVAHRGVEHRHSVTQTRWNINMMEHRNNGTETDTVDIDNVE